ncbi:hypothetical protein COX09_05180 [Candidatus Beckwithbacteria bacterium CG23_combo_of_CG06-09_8_20_14_all_47_9]|uniref:DUF3800 domain-containing protein n=1 Tax=Candidatus Beckwithbacteria bacterium CG23_combo_of_CG06-09_8_20_14_all_47_9 TaxID=1974498 RepID=A0A2H0B2C2_9BACT|nr:MAG: hypothetical protein COX09_05180 [Candidatus Beckwithbacteria bacterium CG23_combo_of_CG06-09_8_20_14_all_47_9]
MSRVTIYIDESGTLPDPKDKVVIVAAVGVTAAEKIDLLFKQIHKWAAFKKRGTEIKFYTSGEKTKTIFFRFLERENFTICVLVIDKLGRKISDTPTNYAALCLLLLQDVANFIKIDRLVFDRHFVQQKEIDVFNDLIKRQVGNDVSIIHVDSRQDKRVNVADMVAGSVLANETGKDAKYFSMIERKIVSIKKVNWKEAKKRLIEKNLLEPVQAPIQTSFLK